jgi:hypothetical protein
VLTTGTNGNNIEIRPMDSMMFSLNVLNLEGPIKMTIEFTPNCSGDIKFEICKDQNNIKEGTSTWTLVNKLSVVLYPSRVMSDKI